eukprot:scaffold266551_cov38-Prasinocladus_malaysianus.AAC.2
MEHGTTVGRPPARPQRHTYAYRTVPYRGVAKFATRNPKRQRTRTSSDFSCRTVLLVATR